MVFDVRLRRTRITNRLFGEDWLSLRSGNPKRANPAKNMSFLLSKYRKPRIYSLTEQAATNDVGIENDIFTDSRPGGYTFENATKTKRKGVIRCRQKQASARQAQRGARKRVQKGSRSGNGWF
ncbi:hypothetical protein HMPREF9413_3846 [Paenibacillus sp. HGF7]|nr:hypothetical protein HMPREF9413_3846 [Paenibacillus sp. HGF7]